MKHEGPTLPSDLVRTHWQSARPASRRGRRWLTALVVVVVVGYLAFAVSLVVTRRELWPLVQPAVLSLFFLNLYRRGTRVTPQDVRQQYGLFAGRRVTWDDVREVLPAGRWRDWGYARLTDGRVLELVGMAPDDVVRLAAALAEARAEPEGSRD